MILPNEVALLLRGWGEEKRRLRIVLRAGWFGISTFCFVCDANAGGATFLLGEEPRNTFDFSFENWIFEFAELPNGDKTPGIGARIKSAICGASTRKDSLWIFPLED